MTTLLEIPLRDATSADLQDLQAKYPDATLRIEADTRLRTNGIDEAQFWAIIDLLDWQKEDHDQILAPAVNALSKFSQTDIESFHDLLNEKLYRLDGRRFAEQLGSNRYTPGEDNHFSVDDFLYTRCGVVANGRNFFELLLRDPSRIPKEFTFESLLYLPNKAWVLKTGHDNYDYFPEIWYETFSNPAGWSGIVPLKERLLNS